MISASHVTKQTDEILDFDTVEDFTLIRKDYAMKIASKILHRGELVELEGSQLYNMNTGEVSDIYANSDYIKQQVLTKIECAKKNDVKIWVSIKCTAY